MDSIELEDIIKAVTDIYLNGSLNCRTWVAFILINNFVTYGRA
jgi:hypothetical protein